LKLTGKFAPPAGYEVVPTAEADRLVEYLLSLKKDFPVPGQSAVAAAPAAAKK
jgi:cytochrome c oxidase cbb3-type subunit 2